MSSHLKVVTITKTPVIKCKHYTSNKTEGVHEENLKLQEVIGDVLNQVSAT